MTKPAYQNRFFNADLNSEAIKFCFWDCYLSQFISNRFYYHKRQST